MCLKIIKLKKNIFLFHLDPLFSLSPYVPISGQNGAEGFLKQIESSIVQLINIQMWILSMEIGQNGLIIVQVSFKL